MTQGVNEQEYVRDADPEKLHLWPGNARRGVVAGIKESIRVNGFAGSLLVQKSTNQIIAGNHRFQAWRELAAEDPEKFGTTIPVTYIDVNDARAEKLNLADNKTADDATWDNAALLDQLLKLDEDDDLLGTGFSIDELDDLQALVDADGEESGETERVDADELGGELDLADVTFGDPRHEVGYGDVWRMGRHTVVCAKLSTDWDLWKDYLEDGVRFCPYPDPYITASKAARNESFLLVQPDRWLAGHLLDKHESLFSDEVPDRIVNGDDL